MLRVPRHNTAGIFLLFWRKMQVLFKIKDRTHAHTWRNKRKFTINNLTFNFKKKKKKKLKNLLQSYNNTRQGTCEY